MHSFCSIDFMISCASSYGGSPLSEPPLRSPPLRRYEQGMEGADGEAGGADTAGNGGAGPSTQTPGAAGERFGPGGAGGRGAVLRQRRDGSMDKAEEVRGPPFHRKAAAHEPLLFRIHRSMSENQLSFALL